MTEEDIKTIEERVEATTGGEWKLQVWPIAEPRVHGIATESCGIVLDNESTGSLSMADATFIAHAHQDVPNLVAEVRRLRKYLDGADDETREGIERLAAAVVEAATQRAMLQSIAEWARTLGRTPVSDEAHTVVFPIASVVAQLARADELWDVALKRAEAAEARVAELADPGAVILRSVHDQNFGWNEGVKHGREAERAAVVAWLRSGLDGRQYDGSGWGAEFAREIESATHIGKDVR